MNTKITDPRKILLTLRKKYCGNNLKRYTKSDSSSSNEFSSEEVPKPLSSSRKSSSEKVNSVLSSNVSVKSLHQNHNSKALENSISEIGANKLRNSIDYENSSSKSLYEDTNKSESEELSSVKTDVDVNTYSDVEEDISDASHSSSVNNVLANVHLLSDDVLEDIETNFGSDNSNINDEERSTRISVVHSIKSIQLGSSLEPPNVELYDYESDFEDSLIESVKSDVTLKTVSTIESLSDCHDDVNVKASSEVNDDVREVTSKEILFNKKSKLSVKTDIISDISKNSDSYEELSISEKGSGTDNESTNDERSKNDSVEEYDFSKSSTLKDEQIDIVNSLLLKDNSNDIRENETIDLDTKPYYIISKPLINNNNSTIEQLGDNTKFPKHISLQGAKSCGKNDIGINVNILKIDVGVNVNFSDESSNDDNICPETKSFKVVDKGTNVTLIKPVYNSVGIQTKAVKSEESFLKGVSSSKILQKKFYIDTSVKSTKSRPFVNASKLSCNLTTKDSDYNPYAFSERVAEGLSAEELVNEMIRNQIAMTKHFMNSHHRLYMQCCQTVQFMNEEYKNKRICFVKQ